MGTETARLACEIGRCRNRRPSSERNSPTLSHLLADLDDAAASRPPAGPRTKSDLANQNRLVQVRLGLASSLYVASAGQTCADR